MTMHPTPTLFADIHATAAAQERRLAGDWILAKLTAILNDLAERSDFSSRDAVFEYLGTPIPMLKARVRRVYHKRRFQLWKRSQAEVAAVLDASIEANKQPLGRVA